MLVAVLAMPPIAYADQASTVPGWFISGSAAEKYQASVDNFVVHSGSSSASLASVTDAEGFEFGTLMQVIHARPHAGERLRFSVFIRTSGVKVGAAAWMRVDGHDGQVLAFDNMFGRGLFREEQSWSRAEVVLDVLPESKVISFGVLLKGDGMVWIDTASLDPVFRHIATTGTPVTGLRLPVAPDDLPPSPFNLGFETTAEL
jgi:hypothetical protein